MTNEAVPGTPVDARAPSTASSNKKRQGRGRPTSKGDDSRDVLFLKGAAAQQTKNPGNLIYYALCEERYDEYAAFPDNHPSKAEICRGIVDEVLRSGGKFRSPTGGTMTYASALQKTKDRMRQIAKPKIRPDHVNENDVVFTRGANNHLYAGNAKWRLLLDQYVTRFYRDFIANGMKDREGASKRRPQYQIDIINEVVSIIRKRGGTFRRGETLEALTDDEIIQKNVARFKDLKKELRKGRVFPIPQRSANGTIACNNTSATSDTIKTEEGSFDASGKDLVVMSFATPAALASVSGQSYTRMLSKPGCTSVKKTVKRAEDLKNLKKETRAKWRRGGGISSRRSNGTRIKDDDEDSGYDSSILPSDDDESEGDGSGSSEEEEFAALIRLSKEKQNMDRRERLKRRRLGQPAPAPPRLRSTASKRRKVSSIPKRQNKEEEGDDDDDEEEAYEKSEYEKLREEKIKRNQRRLVELGLAGNFK